MSSTQAVAGTFPGTKDPQGYNNANPDITKARLIKGATYKDLGTILVCPTRSDGNLHGKVADAINNAIKPMNAPFFKFPFDSIRIGGHEVGRAYDCALANIAGNEGLRKWPFLLTAEHDNLPQPDGLLKLQAAMYANADYDEDGRIIRDADTGILRFHFLGIGGLYYTKSGPGFGEVMSQPMIYGHPQEVPVNFRPQLPIPDSLQECRGIAMGWSIWNLSALLNDKRLGPPYFETKNEWNSASGVVMGTQDLTFCAKAGLLGYRFAVDTSCAVGHMDIETGSELVW